MKREGRQHGMVRTFRILPDPYNPRSRSRLVNRLDSPPTAGLFSRVPSKPTNHSKFTGKCGKARCIECHMGPVQKSKDKAKGAQKLKSTNDVVSSHRLITWRVVENGQGPNYTGLSATGLLDHLAYDSYNDDESYDHEYYASDDDKPEIEIDSMPNVDGDNPASRGNGDDEGLRIGGDNYDDIMSYRDAELVLGQVVEEDEGWCLVEENVIIG